MTAAHGTKRGARARGTLCNTARTQARSLHLVAEGACGAIRCGVTLQHPTTQFFRSSTRRSDVTVSARCFVQMQQKTDWRGTPAIVTLLQSQTPVLRSHAPCFEHSLDKAAKFNGMPDNITKVKPGWQNVHGEGGMQQTYLGARHVLASIPRVTRITNAYTSSAAAAAPRACARAALS